MSKVIRCGLIGCGNIARAYLESARHFSAMRYTAVADVDLSRARDYAQAYQLDCCPSIEELLQREDIDLVVNLTPPPVHAGLIEQALRAGKHVYTEKPFCLQLEDAARLVQLSRELGLQLASSPFTHLGPAQQRVLELIRGQQVIGVPDYVSAEMHNGCIESWHPDPEVFYQIGPLWDVGLYPLSHLVRVMGEVAEVSAQAVNVRPQRKKLDGTVFASKHYDYLDAHLRFRNGGLARLSVSFLVAGRVGPRHGIEFVGPKGQLFLRSHDAFDSEIQLALLAEEETRVLRPTRGTPAGVLWSYGVNLLSEVLLGQRENPFDLDFSYHLLEVLFRLDQAARERQCGPQTIVSRWQQPALAG